MDNKPSWEEQFNKEFPLRDFIWEGGTIGEGNMQEKNLVKIKSFISSELAKARKEERNELVKMLKKIIPFNCEDDCYPGKLYYCRLFQTRQEIEKIIKELGK